MAFRWVWVCAFCAAAALSGCQGDGGSDVASSSAASAENKTSYISALNLDLSVRQPVVIAHRGGGAYAPEGTLQAFLNAAQMGVDAVEFDVWLHPAGAFVALHDQALERTSNCSGLLSDLALEALLKCDAGYWWQPGVAVTGSGVVGPLAGKNIDVPLLEDVFLAMGATFPDLPLVVEIKSSSAGYTRAVADQLAVAMATLLTRVMPSSPVVIQSYDSYVLTRIKSLVPATKTMQLGGAPSYTPTSCGNAISSTVTRGIDILALDLTQLDDITLEACVGSARSSGLSFYVWSVNTPVALQRSIRAGVDGVITDYPACTLSLLGRAAPDNPYTPELARGETYPKCR